MRSPVTILVVSFLAACTGLARNTTVADTPAARLEMARFVAPGTTTETQMITRWGYPTQKVAEGAQTEFIYRDMRNNSDRYVIVTFQYGLATAVRTSDGIACRATFVPRRPTYGFGTHRLAGTCPLDGLWSNANTVSRR